MTAISQVRVCINSLMFNVRGDVSWAEALVDQGYSMGLPLKWLPLQTICKRKHRLIMSQPFVGRIIEWLMCAARHSYQLLVSNISYTTASHLHFAYCFRQGLNAITRRTRHRLMNVQGFTCFRSTD